MANYECQRCYRMFQRVGIENVCPVCAPLDEVDFRKIKEFLTEHPGASSNEVMRHTGVSLRQIKRYLKEERLEIVGDNKGFLRCEICGKPLNSGRFCDFCYKEGIAREIKGVKVTPFSRLNEDKHRYTREIRYRKKENND
ncbi:MAG: MerR family transcriptional regulator [Clostridiaceae bacterium]|jgi:hypothetical protein|nr:MerR family transcriptional regulator [Bacillota bacterium]NLI38859.1 MerR family transcriptional regulator [Clostridiaceae bacterium]